MKEFARVLGVDDGHFTPRTGSETILVGVVFRLDGCVEGILSESIKVDSLDAAEKISGMLLSSRFAEQVSFILLSGANFAGFNVVNAVELFKETGKPVIAVQRRKPGMEKVFNALRKLPFFVERKELFDSLGEVHSFKNIFFQCVGISALDARVLLSKTIFYSNMPEPLRLAHLIASGITIGESTRPK